MRGRSAHYDGDMKNMWKRGGGGAVSRCNVIVLLLILCGVLLVVLNMVFVTLHTSPLPPAVAAAGARDSAKFRAVSEFDIPPLFLLKNEGLAHGSIAGAPSLRSFPAVGRGSVDIKPLLQQCTMKDLSPPNQNRLTALLNEKVGQQRCRAPLDFGSLVCRLQCDVEEPELEDAFQILRLSKYSFDHLWSMCVKGQVSALIWLRSSAKGGPRFFICGGRERVQGRSAFSSTRALLSLLTCMVDVPDVLFALDNLDWAVPQKSETYSNAWLQPLPGVARYSGTSAHPSVLLPTDGFVRATTHCRLHSGTGDFTVCRQIHRSPCLKKPFEQRKNVVFWRGSSTGVPLRPLISEYLPRPALIKEYFSQEGFDVGFVGDPPPSYDKFKKFFLQHTKTPILSNNYCNYKFIVHCDGHTASWGMAHKLSTKSLMLWVPSSFTYREFFYKHLQPWEHFVPAQVSDLGIIKNWLFQDAKKMPEESEAARIAANAANLIKTRLRPEATYCYLARLVESLAAAQKKAPDNDTLKRVGIPDDAWKSFDEFQAYWETGKPRS